MDAANNAHHHHVYRMTPPIDSSTASPEMTHGTMMLHMTFFWGANAEILFNRWPGERGGMYALALIFVFVLAFIVEWLSHSRLIKEDSSAAAAGLIRTLLHTVRVGLVNLVMLAVMSFNVGVFLVAIGGHCLGFLLFGSRLFKKSAVASGSASRTEQPVTS
ncbi:copper transporter 1-like [Cucurbita pepo subsp. pepo]|uniref:copper transporter 1-like n=1 Tax=Cucurbita pepo subsp. pepo TaxID=3664 RepID=UPI000C9D8A79|nr:copper transporter 1-like [Cucurbita pepo subsp. pepo]